jgi:hypothetical protein
MQDDGELIGTSKLIPLEDYKKIEAPFESEFDNFGYVPFLDRAFDPTKGGNLPDFFARLFVVAVDVSIIAVFSNIKY